jgi:DinB superfamily
MTTPAVDHLLYLLDRGFECEDWHSLLGNLHDVTSEEWRWEPPGGRRTIRNIVQHVGSCKFMYENHGFGDATFEWDDPLVAGVDAVDEPTSAIAWLREGQARLRRSVAGLDDAELGRSRRTNWGELKETRWIIAVMIEHDLYHAGEINHVRALHRGDDC